MAAPGGSRPGQRASGRGNRRTPSSAAERIGGPLRSSPDKTGGPQLLAHEVTSFRSSWLGSGMTRPAHPRTATPPEDRPPFGNPSTTWSYTRSSASYGQRQTRRLQQRTILSRHAPPPPDHLRQPVLGDDLPNVAEPSHQVHSPGAIGSLDTAPTSAKKCDSSTSTTFALAHQQTRQRQRGQGHALFLAEPIKRNFSACHADGARSCACRSIW